MFREKLKVLSLFDGLSGAQVALRKLGVPAEYYAVEIDKYAIAITQKNFPGTIQLGDVLQFFVNPECIRTSEMQNLHLLPKNIDLLIGGSPCQGLSVSNNNGQGLEDERSKLFWAYVRILDHYFETQTKDFYFVLENVESMKTKDFVVITNTLGVEPVMLDAALVSAQRRKRYFWTNIPNVKQPKLVPSRIYPNNKIGLVIADILEENADRKIVDIAPERIIKTSYGVRWNGHQKSPFHGLQGCQAMNDEAKAQTLSAMDWKRPPRIVTQGGSQSQKAVAVDKKGFVIDSGLGRKYPYRIVVDNNSQQNRAYVTEGKFPAIRTNSKTTVVFEDLRIERLTWTEIERLAGLSDGYTDLGENNRVEDRGKAIGNGFQIDIVTHLLRFILSRPKPLERSKHKLKAEQGNLF